MLIIVSFSGKNVMFSLIAIREVRCTMVQFDICLIYLNIVVNLNDNWCWYLKVEISNPLGLSDGIGLEAASVLLLKVSGSILFSINLVFFFKKVQISICGFLDTCGLSWINIRYIKITKKIPTVYDIIFHT